MNLMLWDPENLKKGPFFWDTISYLNTGVKFAILDLDSEDDLGNDEPEEAKDRIPPHKDED